MRQDDLRRLVCHCFFLLVMSLLLMVHNQDVIAAETGTCGENLKWKLEDNGTLTISGTGWMDLYNYYNTDPTSYSERPGPAPWADKNIVKIVISDGVESIGDGAFTYCTNLSSVTIPDSVKYIGAAAFQNCTKLTQIRLPNNKTTILQFAFDGCEKLSKIVMPYYDYEMGYLSLANVTSVTDVDFYNSKERWVKFYGDHQSGDYQIFEKPEKITVHCKDGDLKYNGGQWMADNTNAPFNLSGITHKHDLDYYAENMSTSKFDNSLCTLMAAIECCAGDKNSIEAMYKTLGFSEKPKTKNYNDPSFFVLPRDGITYSYGKKENNGTTIILIVLRGTGNTSDLLHDLDVTGFNNNFSVHEGFKIAANNIMGEIVEYLGGEPEYDANTKYFIVGHSLGGATGNLLAADLSVMVGKDSVFNYNFACPNTITSTKSILEDSDAYNPYNSRSNIFNICRSTDQVPSLPGLESSMLLEAKEYAQYGWDLFQCFHTKHDYYWGRWGITKWFDDGILVPGDAHDMSNYLKYVSKSNPHYTSTITYGDNFTWVMNNVFVLCPVDVEILDSNGKTVAAVINNKPQYYTESSREILIATSSDEKCISFPANKNYKIHLIATDKGKMNYVVTSGKHTDEMYSNIKMIRDVSLSSNKEMISSVGGTAAIKDTKLFVIDKDNNKIAEVLEDGSENNLSKEEPKEGSKPENNPGGGDSTSENNAHTNNAVMISSIKLSGISKKIAAGKKLKLSAGILPENATNKTIIWSSSNKKIATVTKSGLVKIKKKKTGGKTVTIIATAADGSGVKATWKIKVMKGVVKSVRIKKAKSTLQAGKTMKLKGTVKATKGANKKLKWTSSNPEWATVSSKGLVKALNAGKGKTVKIKAMATDGSGKKKTVEIKIK